MKRHRSLSRGSATLVLMALMFGVFALVRTLAQRFGEAAALLVIVVFVPLAARLALQLESAARQRRRERVGKCECGYDVRATPERCPECGRLFPPLFSGAGRSVGAPSVERLSYSHAPSP